MLTVLKKTKTFTRRTWLWKTHHEIFLEGGGKPPKMCMNPGGGCALIVVEIPSCVAVCRRTGSSVKLLC